MRYAQNERTRRIGETAGAVRGDRLENPGVRASGPQRAFRRASSAGARAVRRTCDSAKRAAECATQQVGRSPGRKLNWLSRSKKKTIGMKGERHRRSTEQPAKLHELSGPARRWKKVFAETRHPRGTKAVRRGRRRKALAFPGARTQVDRPCSVRSCLA